MIEQSQSRIEKQLQEILATQQRNQSPILSQSLDASSPEGRETWLMLGRFLREEGITPSEIKKYRPELINAMKTTLATLTGPTASPSSFHTAKQFSYASLDEHPGSRTSDVDSASLLGSVFHQESCFLSQFTQKELQMPGAWDKATNIDEGVGSLIQGMEISENEFQSSDTATLRWEHELDESIIG